MNFNFDHSKTIFHEAIGCSIEELAMLEEKWNMFMKMNLNSVINEDGKNTLSLSKMLEIIFSQFTHEEIAVLLAKNTKDKLLSFFNTNQDIISCLISK